MSLHHGWQNYGVRVITDCSHGVISSTSIAKKVRTQRLSFNKFCANFWSAPDRPVLAEIGPFKHDTSTAWFVGVLGQLLVVMDQGFAALAVFSTCVIPSHFWRDKAWFVTCLILASIQAGSWVFLPVQKSFQQPRKRSKLRVRSLWNQLNRQTISPPPE